MDRINVIELPTQDERWEDPSAAPRLVGWFDRDAASKFSEHTDWDAQRQCRVSVNTGSEWDHQMVYRTAGGRWVLHTDSSDKRSDAPAPRYSYVTDDVAREWLLRNGHDDIVAKFFGPIEPERGPVLPDVGGRPEVGPAFSIRFGPELTAALDAQARECGLTRAAYVRQIVQAAVTSNTRDSK